MEENITINNIPTDTVTTILATIGITFSVILLIIIAVYVTASWKIFKKAGQPGWASIIPFYNLYIILKIVGRPGWWLFLYLIPLVNVIITMIVAIDLAKSFGKSEVFGIFALWLFSLFGHLILAFGDAKYIGPSAK